MPFLRPAEYNPSFTIKKSEGLITIKFTGPDFELELLDNMHIDYCLNSMNSEKNLTVAWVRASSQRIMSVLENAVEDTLNGQVFKMKLIIMSDLEKLCRKIILEYNIKKLMDGLNPSLEEVLEVTNELFTKEVIES